MAYSNVIEQLNLLPPKYHDQDGTLYFADQEYDHPRMPVNVIISNIIYFRSAYQFTATYHLPHCKGKIRWVWDFDRVSFVPHYDTFQIDRRYTTTVKAIMGTESYEKYGHKVLDGEIEKVVPIFEERFMDWILEN